MAATSVAVRCRPRRIRAAGLGITTATVVAIQRANPSQPGQRPLLLLGPAFADLDEIAADMRPAKDQHHVAQLHLGHGFVRRVAVDHQHHAGIRREVALGNFVAAGGIQAKDHRVLPQEHPQPPAISRLAFLATKTIQRVSSAWAKRPRRCARAARHRAAETAVRGVPGRRPRCPPPRPVPATATGPATARWAGG